MGLPWASRVLCVGVSRLPFPFLSSRDGAFGATLWRRFAGREFGLLLVGFTWAARVLGHGG